MLSVKVRGDKKLQRGMGKRKQKLTKRRKINAQAIALVDRWVQKNFQSEGKPYGGWEPLALSTMMQRRRGPRPDRSVAILQDTGTMRQRWKHLFTKNKAILQSGVDYSKYHQKGTRKMPARPILPEKKMIWPELEKLYTHWMRKALR